MSGAGRILVIEFLSTWRAGTGRDEGMHLDALAERDVDGLPYLPGRALRGLLRDAAECLAAWGAAGDAASLGDLFGGLVARPASGDAPARSVSTAGRLTITDARLPEAQRRALARAQAERGGAAVAGLFVVTHRTALDADRGTAKTGSLRSIELVVPLALQASVALRGDEQGDAAAEAWRLLDAVVPLVHAAGAGKTRGDGRCRLRWAAPAPPSVAGVLSAGAR